MNMTKFQLFLILFTVYYIKEGIVPLKKKILKHPMELEFIFWPGRIYNSRNCWSTMETKSFIHNKYMSRMSFEVILSSLHYTNI